MSEPTALELALAELIRHFRQREIEPLRQRIGALEQRDGGDTIAGRVFSGRPVDNNEWLRFVGRLYRDFGGG